MGLWGYGVRVRAFGCCLFNADAETLGGVEVDAACASCYIDADVVTSDVP